MPMVPIQKFIEKKGDQTKQTVLLNSYLKRMSAGVSNNLSYLKLCFAMTNKCFILYNFDLNTIIITVI